jgi:RNA polymerase sigma-70 factor (ECF subfamily)
MDDSQGAMVDGYPSFDIVLELFHRKVYNLVYRLLSDRDEAADITQEVFVKAYKAYSRFDGSSSAIYPWLCRIAVNSCKNKFKEIGRRSRYEVMSLDDPIDAEESGSSMDIRDDTANPAGILQQQELAVAINDAIGQLPPEYRVVVVLRDMQGLSYKEISDATGLTMDVVKIRLYRGREILRRRLSPYMNG